MIAPTWDPVGRSQANAFVQQDTRGINVRMNVRLANTASNAEKHARIAPQQMVPKQRVISTRVNACLVLLERRGLPVWNRVNPADGALVVPPCVNAPKGEIAIQSVESACVDLASRERNANLHAH